MRSFAEMGGWVCSVRLFLKGMAARGWIRDYGLIARGRASGLQLPLDDERAEFAGDGANQRLETKLPAKFLPKLASGEWIRSVMFSGLTEPSHGSDPGSMVTRAR